VSVRSLEKCVPFAPSRFATPGTISSDAASGLDRRRTKAARRATIREVMGDGPD
jgi:hypothetical protein